MRGAPQSGKTAAKDALRAMWSYQVLRQLLRMLFVPNTTSSHRSPFCLLGVTTRDNRKTIVGRSDELSLTLDANACQQAWSDLTNPRTRLTVEMAWLPGVSPRKANALIQLLSVNPMSIRNEKGLPTLAHCNLLAVAFETVDSSDTATNIAAFGEQLAHLVDALDPDEILRSVNEDRSVAGFPEGGRVSGRSMPLRQISKWTCGLPIMSGATGRSAPQRSPPSGLERVGVSRARVNRGSLFQRQVFERACGKQPLPHDAVACPRV